MKPQEWTRETGNEIMWIKMESGLEGVKESRERRQSHC